METDKIQKKNEILSNEITKVIRFEIEGDWDAYEMSHFLNTVTDLYFFGFFFLYFEIVYPESLLEENKKSSLSNLFQKLEMNLDAIYLLSTAFNDPDSLPNYIYSQTKENIIFPKIVLNVSKLQYNSPGVTDFVGIGQIVGHIKDFVLKLIDIKITTEQRKLEDEKRKLEIAGKNLENEQMKIELHKKMAEVEKLQLENKKLKKEIKSFNSENNTVQIEQGNHAFTDEFILLNPENNKRNIKFTKQAIAKREKVLIDLINNGKIRGVKLLTD